MASVVTNKLKFRLLDWVFRRTTMPTVYKLQLFTDAVTPTADTNTASELTEVTNGNGYTAGGVSVNPNATDFDTLTEVDASDWALIQLKDYAYTASGGTIPNVRYPALLDDNATPANREVYVAWDLGSTITIQVGQTLTLSNAELKLT